MLATIASSLNIYGPGSINSEENPLSSHISHTAYRANWFEFLQTFGAFLPRFLIRTLSATIGYLYCATHPQKALVLKNNLKLLGNPSPPSPSLVYAEFAKVLGDYFYLGSRPLSAALKLVDERHGFENLQAAQNQGKGALLLMPHFSFFEIGGAVMQEIGLPMVALTNPEPSPELTQWRAEYRKRWGIETVEIGQDSFQFLQIVKLLEAGKFVGALFDRPHPTQSFSAEVPGGHLPCSSGIILLALLARCPIVPVVVTAKPNGCYRLDAFAPISVEKQGTSTQTLQHYTQLLIDQLLPTIQKNPQQWFQFASLTPPDE